MRAAIAACSVALCALLIWASVFSGLSRLFTVYTMKTGNLDGADNAVRLTPADPEAHRIRGAALKGYGRLEEAIREYEAAVRLRPADYVLWLELGITRDAAEDAPGALDALGEAVRLAPAYAEPRWQLGNVELRAGRLEEAFAEMRQAAMRNSSFLPQLIDLAWAVSGGNVPALERLLQLQNVPDKLALARFMARHAKAEDAARIFRDLGDVSDNDRRALLSELLSARQFRTAYEIWSAGGKRAGGSEGTGFTDSGFEEKIDLKEQGFGWQVQRSAATVQVSIVNDQPHGGSHSLRLDWKGNSDPSAPIISQLVPVEPNARYRLHLFVLTDQLSTGGPPFVSIRDPGDSHEIAQSAAFQVRTTPWQDYTVEFMTGKDVQALLVELRRQNCSSGPCPVFGSLWLDDFSLRKL